LFVLNCVVLEKNDYSKKAVTIYNQMGFNPSENQGQKNRNKTFISSIKRTLV